MVPWCLRSWMWSQTSCSVTNETCFFASSTSNDATSRRMANRCPHLPQTTVSMECPLETASPVPRIRLAMLGSFTNAAPGAVAGRDHCHDHCHVHRHRRQSCAEPVVWLHSL